MIFDSKQPDSENEDFFDTVPESDSPKEEIKKPTFKPEDPDYWEDEESEWDHLRPNNSGKIRLIVGGCLLLTALIVGCYLRYFSPYITDATQYGYVDHIESRGTFFRTYEGVLLPYKELMDTTRLYRRDFIFSAADDKVASELKRAMIDTRPVRVEYKRYHATLPWRGSSKIIITSVDSVDPHRILPPEYSPR